MRNIWYWIIGLVAIAAVGAWWATSNAAEAGTVRLCTGASDGNYAAAGEMIKSDAKDGLTVEVVKDTGGTWGNIKRALDLPPEDVNACDAFIGQPDGLAQLKRTNPGNAARVSRIGQLHREFLFVICNKDSGVGNLNDLEGTSRPVAIGADGSGGWLVWQNFLAEDSGYDSIDARPIGGDDAIIATANGDVDCMLVPAGLTNGTAAKALDPAGFGDQLVLVPATDKDFNDAVDAEGNGLYENGEIEASGFGYWTNPNTITWRASVYVNKDRVQAADRTALAFAVKQAQKQAIAAFGGE